VHESQFVKHPPSLGEAELTWCQLQIDDAWELSDTPANCVGCIAHVYDGPPPLNELIEKDEFRELYNRGYLDAVTRKK